MVRGRLLLRGVVIDGAALMLMAMEALNDGLSLVIVVLSLVSTASYALCASPQPTYPKYIPS